MKQFLSFVVLSLMLACNPTPTGESPPISEPTPVASPVQSATPDPVPSPSALPSPLPSPSPSVSPSPTATSNLPCANVSKCLAIKYVVYGDQVTGNPIVTRAQADGNITVINRLWQNCSIGFEIENFVVVDAKSYGLTFNTAAYSELDDVRRIFMDKVTLLVATTGKWDRRGTLGNTPANAWTAMPGNSALGAVLEQPVGTYGPIIAHELGHYLGLDHVSDITNIMNPVIYNSSTALTSDQCKEANQTVVTWWQAMLR